MLIEITPNISTAVHRMNNCITSISIEGIIDMITLVSNSYMLFGLDRSNTPTSDWGEISVLQSPIDKIQTYIISTMIQHLNYLIIRNTFYPSQWKFYPNRHLI